MIEQNQIQEWVKNGTISQDQAEKMLTDVVLSKKEQSSGSFITSIVSLGSVLLGIGAILFVAASWEWIPDLFKILLLLGATFGVYYLGYVFAYKKQNYPRVGAGLIFLGALLFGASVFLIAQIYNMNTGERSTYLLLGVWLLGVLPVAYAFISKSLASLAALLFLSIVFLMFTTETNLNDNSSRFIIDTLSVGIISGVVLFSIGGFHYISEKFQPIARIYQLFGLQLSILIVFLLSMSFPYDFSSDLSVEVSSGSIVWVSLFGVIALVFGLVNLFFGIVKTKIFFAENIAAVTMLALSLLLFFSVGPGTEVLFRTLFTSAFVGIILMMLYIGYENMDITVVNKATSWATVFIIIKYFEWFWSMSNPFLFFIVGGIALITGGIALEKKRKEIRARFAMVNIEHHE